MGFFCPSHLPLCWFASFSWFLFFNFALPSPVLFVSECFWYLWVALCDSFVHCHPVSCLTSWTPDFLDNLDALSCNAIKLVCFLSLWLFSSPHFHCFTVHVVTSPPSENAPEKNLPLNQSLPPPPLAMEGPSQGPRSSSLKNLMKWMKC